VDANLNTSHLSSLMVGITSYRFKHLGSKLVQIKEKIQKVVFQNTF